jgi:hypothetical protein
MDDQITSPKLKEAIKQIRQILQSYDIAAVVVLHTPEHSEFLVRIDTSYSVARYEKQGIRIKTNPAEKEEVKRKKLGDTSNMLHFLSFVSGKVSLDIIDVSEALDKAIGATHEPVRFKPGTHSG